VRASSVRPIVYDILKRYPKLLQGFPDAARKDALTKKPLDLEEEDEARKFETSKWLESHFGSDSRSSHGSLDADDSLPTSNNNTSYINVTMKSCTPKEREYQSSSRHQRRARDSDSPSGYFHGISEWSERYQGKGTTLMTTIATHGIYSRLYILFSLKTTFE